MEKRRGSWLARGASGRPLSRVLRADNVFTKAMFLNLITFVGLIFLALTLLHLFYGPPGGYSVLIYAAIFLLLEGVVIGVRLCTCLRDKVRHNPLPDYVESVVVTVGKESKSLNVSSYQEVENTFYHQRRNSL